MRSRDQTAEVAGRRNLNSAEETRLKSSGLTRRSFLKTAAVTAGGAAVATGTIGSFAGCSQLGPSSAESQTEDEIYTSFCRNNCGSYGCNLAVSVREGKVVKVEHQPYPDESDDPISKGRARICKRGMSNGQRLYATNRVNYPMKLKEGAERGSGEWEQITWDEAFSLIGEKWGSYIEQYGAGSILRWAIYGNNASLHGTGAWSRLANCTGIGSIGDGADMALMYTTYGYLGNLGYGSDGPTMAAHCKNFIVWGANPAETWPHEYRYIRDAMDNGCKVTVIDPRKSLTACKSDFHVPLRPSTDPALAMAVANYLIEHEMIDEDFLTTKTNAACLIKEDGYFLRRSDRDSSFEAETLSNNWMTGLPITDDTPYVFDTSKNEAMLISEAVAIQLTGPVMVDGVSYDTAFDRYKERVSEWTLEKAEEVCGVSSEQIIQLAESIYEGPSSMMVGNGAGHTYYSHTFFTSAMSLSMLTGNFYKPGAGCANAGVSPISGWSADYLWPYMVQMTMPGPSYSPGDLPEIIESGSYLGQDVAIKSIIIFSGNPLGGDSGRTAILEALKQVEFIITVDMSFTDSALMSDLVLPCCHWFETWEVGGAQYIPYALLGEQAVEPLFEHLNDYDICKGIATSLGLGDNFHQSLEEVVQSLTDNSPQPDYMGEKITWERLSTEKNIRTIPEGYYDTTCSCQDGLLPIYLEKVAPRFPSTPLDEELEHLPYFEPPIEAWPESVGSYAANEKAAEYPLIYFNFHTHWMTHTTYSHIEWLQEIWREPFLEINPLDAEARGISNQDTVRVFNDRGYVVVKAHIDGKIRPGTVSVPHGWQKDQFIEGHYQDLTILDTHAFDHNGNYWDGLCEVELYEKGGQ